MYLYLIDVQNQWLDVVSHDQVMNRIQEVYRPIHLESWQSTDYHPEVYLLTYSSDQNIVDVILASPITMTRVTPDSISMVMEQMRLSNKFPQSLMARVEDPTSEWFQFNLDGMGSNIVSVTGP